ncbi:MAG TPA: tetratricopeptide repeat protein [Bacteroidota bacterium]|nr:tetratricopeptide repeat protein [Bacteroidota bacterium]
MELSQLELKLARRPHSPLFARVADEYLKSGRTAEAKELCSSGLIKYPSYNTARLVLAKCLLEEKQFSQARELLSELSLFHADSGIIRELITLCDSGLAQIIDLPREEPPPHVVASREVPHAEDDSPVLDAAVLEREFSTEELIAAEEVLFGEITPKVESPPVGEEFASVSFEEEGGIVNPIDESPGFSSQIEEMLSPPEAEKESMPAAVEVPVEEIIETFQSIAPPPEEILHTPIQEPVLDELAADAGDGRIVSKTLAEIYVTQGAYDEAILTYRLLIKKRPEESGEFEKRLREIFAIKNGHPS